MRYESPYDLSCFDRVDIVAVMEAFADASEMDGHLSVGALLFRKKNIKPFEKEWRGMLRKYGLTHFHMTDCNAGRDEYEGLSDPECDECARCAIALILKYAVKGTIFSVRKSDFYEIVTKNGIVPNPFTLGVWIVLFDIWRWANENDPKARISYVFESGDEHQHDADRLLNGIAADPDRRARFHYRVHAFLPKLSSLPTQASDILAWHGAKHTGRIAAGNHRLRGDFQAIVSQLRVADAYYDREKLKSIVGIAERTAGPRGNEIAGVANRYHALSPKQQVQELISAAGGEDEAAQLVSSLLARSA